MSHWTTGQVGDVALCLSSLPGLHRALARPPLNLILTPNPGHDREAATLALTLIVTRNLNLTLPCISPGVNLAIAQDPDSHIAVTLQLSSLLVYFVFEITGRRT